jgi:hypothetical protein
MLGFTLPKAASQKLKRSKVAKTSCLIPYPKLEKQRR